MPKVFAIRRIGTNILLADHHGIAYHPDDASFHEIEVAKVKLGRIHNVCGESAQNGPVYELVSYESILIELLMDS